jgi:hypothetical protein
MTGHPVQTQGFDSKRLPGQKDDTLGDINGLVAHTLQVNINSHGRGYKSQVYGHGLLQGQEFQALVIYLILQPVYNVFFVYNTMGQVCIALVKCKEGVFQ